MSRRDHERRVAQAVTRDELWDGPAVREALAASPRLAQARDIHGLSNAQLALLYGLNTPPTNALELGDLLERHPVPEPHQPLVRASPGAPAQISLWQATRSAFNEATEPDEQAQPQRWAVWGALMVETWAAILHGTLGPWPRYRMLGDGTFLLLRRLPASPPLASLDLYRRDERRVLAIAEPPYEDTPDDYGMGREAHKPPPPGLG